MTDLEAIRSLSDEDLATALSNMNARVESFAAALIHLRNAHSPTDDGRARRFALPLAEVIEDVESRVRVEREHRDAVAREVAARGIASGAIDPHPGKTP